MRKVKKFMTYALTAMMILNTFADNLMFVSATESVEDIVLQSDQSVTADDKETGDQEATIDDKASDDQETDIDDQKPNDQATATVDKASDDQATDIDDQTPDDQETATDDKPDKPEDALKENQSIVITYQVNNVSYGYINSAQESIFEEIISKTDPSQNGASANETAPDESAQTDPNETELKGATAYPYEGYEFINWTNADGVQVSTEAFFIPTEKATAHYTANFRETESVDKKDAEEKYPSIDFGEHTLADMKVQITAPEGAFPEGTKVTMEQIETDAAMDYAEKTLTEKYTVLVDAKGVNITFFYQDKTIQPNIPIQVTITDLKLDKAENHTWIHVNDDETTEIIENAQINENTATASLSQFSPHVIAATDTKPMPKRALIETVPVAVYATDGSKTGGNTDIMKIMNLGYCQTDGYYPIGTIYLPISLFAGKESPYIKTDQDYATVMNALGVIDTTTCIDSAEGKGSLNQNNKINENLHYVQKDLNGTAGSKKTALFDWKWPEYSDNIRLIDKKQYQYHLDLRFDTVQVTYIGRYYVDNVFTKAGEIGSRMYLKSTPTKKPGESDDWYLNGIEPGYQIEGYYADEACQTPYIFGNPATSDQKIYVKLKKDTVSVIFKFANGTPDQVHNGLTVGADTPTVTTPVKSGYQFAGWKDDLGNKYTENNLPKQVTRTVVYTAQWEIQHTKYTVEHYLQNSDGTYQKTPTDTEGASGAVNEKVTPPVKSYPGFVSPKPQEITLQESAEKNIVKYYYDLEVKTITLDKNLAEPVTYTVPGFSDIDQYYKDQFVKYDKEAKTLQYTIRSTPFLLPVGASAGYDFRGWKENGNWAVDYFKDGAEHVVIEPEKRFEDRTFVAQWAKSIETKLYVLNPGLTDAQKKTMHENEKHFSTSTVTSYDPALFTKAVGTAKVRGLVTDQYVSVKSAAYDKRLDEKYVSDYQIAPEAGGPAFNSDTNMLTMEFDGYIYKANADDIAWYVVKKEKDHWHVDGNAFWKDPIPVDRQITYVARVDGEVQTGFLNKTSETVPYMTDLTTITAPTPTGDIDNLYLVEWSWSEDGTHSKDFHTVVNGNMPNKNITVYVDYQTKTAIRIKAEDIEKGYDGEKALPNDHFILQDGSLRTGDELSVTTEISVPLINVTDDGKEKHVIRSFKICAADGQDVTEQYAVEVLPGDVTITPAKLTITTESATKYFDNTPLTAGGSYSGLQGEDIIQFTVTGSQRRIGSSPNTYTIDWLDTLPENYQIEETIGTLTVKYKPEPPVDDPSDPTPTPTPPTPTPQTPQAPSSTDVQTQAVLGARQNGQQAVLGARIGAKTGDENNPLASLHLMGLTGLFASLYVYIRKRKLS